MARGRAHWRGRSTPLIGATGVVLMVALATSCAAPPHPAAEAVAPAARPSPSPTPVASVAAGVDLVATAGGWRTHAPVAVVPRRTPDPALVARLGVSVVDAVLGDVDGDGKDDVVVLFVRPPRPTLAAQTLATPVPTDPRGRTLHLGVYDEQLNQKWVAGTVMRPISSIAVCDGNVVLAFASGVGANDRVGVGVITWRGYGFTGTPQLPDLPGDGVPACAHVDGDPHLDPVVLGEAAS